MTKYVFWLGRAYNQKSDIWSLGCILYEMCALKRTFQAPTLPALVLKIMRGNFQPLPDHYSKSLKGKKPQSWLWTSFFFFYSLRKTRWNNEKASFLVWFYGHFLYIYVVIKSRASKNLIFSQTWVRVFSGPNVTSPGLDQGPKCEQF